MAYFRQLSGKLNQLLHLFSRKDKWLILFMADPDALASGMALKRIMAHRVGKASLAMVNEVTRPDNMAMIRYLQIPVQQLTDQYAAQFDKFALVDSQPHHHPEYEKYSFSVVIDHHPLNKDNPVQAPFTEIQPKYGATSSLMTELLYNFNLRPGKRLATALLYGIKTDTHSFEQSFHDVDIRAFRYLTKLCDHVLLRKIVRSEYRVEWLQYFSKAFKKMRLLNDGLTVYMDEVDSTDILVILADFFQRVHDISWDIVSGVKDGQLISVLRGDGVKADMGVLAKELFGDYGKAGGRQSMARAEIPLENLQDEHPQQFIWERLRSCKIINHSPAKAVKRA